MDENEKFDHEQQGCDDAPATDQLTDESRETEVLLGKGLDVGTANIAAATQTADGEVNISLERNAFLDIKGDVYSKNMLTKLKVPYVVHNGTMVVIGESAFELANIFGRETRRPMSDGLISPHEVDALPMIKLIISKALGEPAQPGENCFFTVPAESIDADNNIIYHQGLFEGMLRQMGYNAQAINEGHAVIFAELAEDDFTGIGISLGGGMVNVCVS
jgi:actin-like ATPase involved in cell morphogenesis